MAREPGNFIYISHTQVDEYAKDLGILKDAERFAYNRFRLEHKGRRRVVAIATVVGSQQPCDQVFFWRAPQRFFFAAGDFFAYLS